MNQLQVHVDSWTITLVLFILSLILIKTGPAKVQKIFHMILRLFLVITLLTGIGLLVSYHFKGIVLLKGTLGIFLLFLIEMVVIKTRNNDRVLFWWFIFIVDIILVGWIGFSVAH